MRRTPILALALLVSLLGIAACGDDDDDTASTGDDTTSEAGNDTIDASDDTEETGAEEVDPTAGKTKPEVQVPETAPRELMVTDIEEGTGAVAENGKTLSMQYVGVAFSTKEQFDASWDVPGGPRPFNFVLGAGDVIDGWDQGLVGMKVGGRRQLVIPPDLAYKEAGYPPVIAPNETLVFVVDLIAVS